MNDRDRDARADRPNRQSGQSSRNSGGRGSYSNDRAPRRDGQGSNDRQPRRDGDRSYDRKPRREGEGSYDRAPRRGGDDRSYDRKPRRDGEGSHDRAPRRDGEGGYARKPQRDGERSFDRGPRRNDDRGYNGGARRDSDRTQDRRPRRDGEDFRGRAPQREGGRGFDRQPRRDGEGGYDRRPHRDGERSFDRKPRREGDRDFDRKPRRDGGYGDRPVRRDGERGGYERKPRRDGEGGHDRRPQRDGDRSFDRGPRREGDRPQFGRGGTRGAGKSDRGGRGREFTEAERLQHELRPVRSEHDDPFIPEDVTPEDLHPGARNELKTLQPETAERVAQHLAMAGMLLGDDPELAHQHAISASRRAGRIPVARETLAVTAYHIGDYALALRELRTFRRLTGSQGHLALMVECERALGRPERGIETGLAAELSELKTEQRVQLAIAMSGARLDLGQTQQALFELEIAELDPSKAFSWSPELFAAYANVLEDLGREVESKKWRDRAILAEEALSEHLGGHDQIEVIEIYEHAPREERNRHDVRDADGQAESDAVAEEVEATESDATPPVEAEAVEQPSQGE